MIVLLVRRQGLLPQSNGRHFPQTYTVLQTHSVLLVLRTTTTTPLLALIRLEQRPRRRQRRSLRRLSTMQTQTEMLCLFKLGLQYTRECSQYTLRSYRTTTQRLRTVLRVPPASVRRHFARVELSSIFRSVYAQTCDFAMHSHPG